ncbi:MAG: WD40 repeat domain-containing protein [Pseudomonadota bacterium]
MSGLIASDLPRLEHIIRRPSRIDEWALRRQDETIVVRSGTQVSQWPLQQPTVLLKSSLTRDLPVVVPQPIVVRFAVPAGSSGTPLLGLVPRHQRLSDIRLSVQAPAGAVLVLNLDELAQTADLTALDLGVLARDAGVSLGRSDGEWVVSAFDARPGETGSIAVSLGARGSELPPPQPVVLADPMLLPAESAVLAPGGRYAVTQPGSAARLFTVWDLRSDAWQASYDPGGDVQWLGITAQARAALYLQSARITGFRLRDGSAYPIESIAFPVAAATFSDNQRWLAAQSIDNGGLVTVVDVLTDSARSLRLDAPAERIVISDSGDMLAVIGSDRSVTILNVADGSQRARYLLSGDFRAGYFSQGDEHLILHTTSGAMRSFATRPSAQPVASWEEGVVWTAAQDRRSSLSLIGASGRGFVLHDFNRSRDLSLPFSGLTGQALAYPYLRLRSNIAALMEPEAGTISIWRPQLSALPVGSRLVRKAWLSPTAQAFAFVDRNEQFSVVRMDAGQDELEVLEESVSLISHSQPPELVRFSKGDQLALSIESTGLFRVRHVDDGQFFDFLGKNSDGVLDAAFSPDSSQFLILGARAYSVHDSQTGELLYREVREQSLRAVIPQVGGSGWLLMDVEGGLWQLPRVQPGQPVTLQSRSTKLPEDTAVLWYASQRWLVAGTDEHLLIKSDHSQAGFSFALGGEISEVRLTEDESALLARAGNWLYRIALHRYGGKVTHARLLPADALAYRGFAIRDRHGMAVALLAGVDEPALRLVSLSYADEKPVTGAPEVLAQRWSWLSEFGAATAVSDPSSND